MRRWTCTALAILALGALPTRHAGAAVNVERQGSENPVLEVAKSTIYGGLAGLVVGSAIALATEDTDSDGDVIRTCYAGGTIIGLFGGIIWVASRPQPTRAMLQMEEGRFALHPPAPAIGPAGSLQVPVVAVRF